MDFSSIYGLNDEEIRELYDEAYERLGLCICGSDVYRYDGGCFGTWHNGACSLMKTHNLDNEANCKRWCSDKGFVHASRSSSLGFEASDLPLNSCDCTYSLFGSRFAYYYNTSNCNM